MIAPREETNHDETKSSFIRLTGSHPVGKKVRGSGALLPGRAWPVWALVLLLTENDKADQATFISFGPPGSSITIPSGINARRGFPDLTMMPIRWNIASCALRMARSPRLTFQDCASIPPMALTRRGQS